MPGIFVDKWEDVYNSIISSTSRSFELIVVTNGYGLYTPKTFWMMPNIKIVKDYGSPVRAHAIGASLAEGKLITWIPDDGKFAPYGLQTALEKFDEMGENKKNILTYKFTENEKVYSDEYYKINFHQDKEGNGIGSKHIPDNYYILNHCIMHRTYYEELGGFDCSYEGTAMAYIDFSIRAQYDGARVQLLKGMPILNCTQFESQDPAHSCVHNAQLSHDEPYYSSVYKRSDWAEKVKIKLTLSEEWRRAPIGWPRKYSPIMKDEHWAYGSIKGHIEPEQKDNE
jgi:hypothetical protein